MTKALPYVAGCIGMIAVVVAIYGLAGIWWGLLTAGVSLVGWAILSAADQEASSPIAGRGELGAEAGSVRR